MGFERGEIVPIDFVSDIGLQGPPCYYNSLHDGGLEQIARHYPGATIMLVTREPMGWARSMSKWGSILLRWRKVCGFDGSRHNSKEMDYWSGRYLAESPGTYWSEFYEAHTQKIREFALENLGLTYVEAELGEDLGTVLEKYTGVSPECVMDCHPHAHHPGNLIFLS